MVPRAATPRKVLAAVRGLGTHQDLFFHASEVRADRPALSSQKLHYGPLGPEPVQPTSLSGSTPPWPLYWHVSRSAVRATKDSSGSICRGGFTEKRHSALDAAGLDQMAS